MARARSVSAALSSMLSPSGASLRSTVAIIWRSTCAALSASAEWRYNARAP
eukprot:CAMPEP_0119387476 /NCGR_PEP_ID=MMETSP1334-20130426/100837_1 /TAXON_ID=127549 /ORGANISM="Calcidiscus leptoporus, Strain RCC1130" /LENGTH=50 /DNA_ID=CAMNT_0007409229 /DNA_START=38 /DNA_END=187 /DNA_ORIENTATION=-